MTLLSSHVRSSTDAVPGSAGLGVSPVHPALAYPRSGVSESPDAGLRYGLAQMQPFRDRLRGEGGRRAASDVARHPDRSQTDP